MYRLNLIFFFLFFLSHISGQGKKFEHKIHIGIIPYNYYFSEKTGRFNFGFDNHLPTFEYALKYKKHEIVLRHSVTYWVKSFRNYDFDTMFLQRREFKNLMLAYQREIKCFRNMYLQTFVGVHYTHGYEGFQQNAPNSFQIYWVPLNTFGMDVGTRLKYYYLPTLSVQPNITLHLNTVSRLNGFSFLILFGFDF